MPDGRAKATPQETLKRFDRAMLIGVLGLPVIGTFTFAQGLLRHQTFSVWMGAFLLCWTAVVALTWLLAHRTFVRRLPK